MISHRQVRDDAKLLFIVCYVDDWLRPLIILSFGFFTIAATLVGAAAAAVMYYYDVVNRKYFISAYTVHTHWQKEEGEKRNSIARRKRRKEKETVYTISFKFINLARLGLAWL